MCVLWNCAIVNDVQSHLSYFYVQISVEIRSLIRRRRSDLMKDDIAPYLTDLWRSFEVPYHERFIVCMSNAARIMYKVEYNGRTSYVSSDVFDRKDCYVTDLAVSPSPDLVSGISYLRLCVYHRHLDSFKASWRQYFFARPTRNDSARSWLLRLLELRLTNFPTYLLTYLLTSCLFVHAICTMAVCNIVSCTIIIVFILLVYILFYVMLSVY